MKVLKCRDVGFDCNAEIREETEEKVLQKVAERAKSVHNLNELSEQAVEKIRAVTCDENA